ncbi:MAG TPA: FAD-linked oxidase C-terminal domain-containing protein [Candidatus Baltobacteraceae bacterium]|nr:FAD-linked oxidase C-terminal domain-containing protein [Candidatus Baltobacteraceae bacterium]
MLLHDRLADALGADAVKTAPEDLRVYAFDAYTEGRLPAAVVLPASTREVSAVVKIARDCGEPIVPRGAGTGLCGGAVPIDGGIVLSFARMNRILDYQPARRRARVQPGLINLDLSRASASDGLFYAPDPSSQRIATIGGNIATNAGGPHCLSYGTTVNHVIALEIVDDRGEVFTTDIDRPGYDLTAALVGSEGTLGLVTSAWVRLARMPEAVRVWLATFSNVEAASDAVSSIIAAGIVPTALEMMDAVATRAVEAAFKAGYPTDAGAVLLIEHAGLNDDMDTYESEIAHIVREHGANSWRAARSQSERDALWAGRKGAAGAMGRLAPNYYLQDVCVRRSTLPKALHAVETIAGENGLVVANVFHAGDGNLHPLLCYDKRDRKQVAAVIESGNQILQMAVDLGGTVSGEHGIGYEKREAMTAVYSSADLAAMARVREVFDPARIFNPEKIFPAGTRCPEVASVA